MIAEGVYELSHNDRATWGICPVCDAKHGDPCNQNVGIHLGRNAKGEIPPGGAHLARLQAAPNAVRVSPVR